MRDSFFRRGAGIAVLAGLCALALLTAGVAAIRAGVFGAVAREVSAPSDWDDAAQAAADPLTEFRAEREELRARQLAEINEIVYGENTDAETRALAQRQALLLCEREEKENTLEGLLRVRGCGEAVCTVREDSVNVVLRGGPLTRQESAVIYDLVLRETGVTGGNVKIIPIQ